MARFVESLSVDGDILPLGTDITIGSSSASLKLASSVDVTVNVGGTGAKKLWHEGNDGSGSGLDSDLLDGQEGTYYQAWANLTGVPGSFTPSSHVLATTSGLGGEHTVSGLTTGQVLRATGATTVAFQVLSASDIPNLDAAKTTTGTFNISRIPTITVAKGGTGLTSLTAGNYLNAATTTTIQQRTPAQVLSDIGALASSSYTASDVLTKIKTVDGSGSGLDADLLDGNDSAYFLAASSYTAADVLTKIKTVDGTGSGLDADLLAGQPASYYLSSGGGTAITSGQTGGTDGKVVRVSSANTFTNAANTDTPAALSSLLFKQSGNYYPTGNLITGLSSLTAGTKYWLSTAGDITSSIPTPSGTVTAVYIGTAISTTELLFTPGAPVAG